MKKYLLVVALLCLPSMAHAQASVVAQAKQDLKAAGYQVENKACTDFEIAKIVAGRIPGAGLLTKDCCGDENDPNRTHCVYKETWYSHDIVAFADGSVADIAIDGGGANGISFELSPPDSSLVARYRSALSLGLNGVVGNASPVPVPTPTPVPTPVPTPAPPLTDYTGLLERILESQAQLLESTNSLIVISKDTNTHVVNIDRTFGQTMGAIGAFVGKYIAPAIGGFLIAKKAGV